MSKADQGPIVGIDLGTTNSVVAALVDGQLQVLAEDGEKILPSVVGVDAQNNLITGVVARNQQIAFPDRTIASVKRYMGSMEKLQLGDQQFTPPEISAIILRRLRDRASRVLGVPVSRAVITVPAFFDESQRQATREAGELAGLTVERIINEPTAATLVYLVGSKPRMHLVVYDFGGGTFDVSVVSMEAGVVEVLSSRGDTKLGGDDLDAALMKYVADEFFAAHNIDLRKSASTRWRLLQASEKAKRELSTDETVSIREEFIAEKDGMPLHLDVQITRSIYEGLIETMIDRTIECVDQALRDAKLTINQIDDLVLVGGSTRTPLVEQRLRDEFKLEPSRAVDPDLAVSLGAATQAAMHDGVAVGPVLVDVTSHTLGIEAMIGLGLDGPQLAFSPIIHRNTPLPAKYEQAYQAVHDQQKVAEIHVLQGEHQDVSRNQSIGVFKLDLDGARGDRAKIVVRFDLTLDGTLKVTATQVATARSEVLTVNNALSQFREQDRDQARARLSKMFDHSSETFDKDDLPQPGKWSVHTVEQTRAPKMASTQASSAAEMLAKARRIGPQIGGEDAEEIALLCEQLEAAIAADDEATINSLCAELDDVLFYVQ